MALLIWHQAVEPAAIAFNLPYLQNALPLLVCKAWGTERKSAPTGNR